METIILLATVFQGGAISLGMGASTLAIVNFFVAIGDGTIDAGERKMMGVVYVVLRVAMVLILVTELLLNATVYFGEGAALPSVNIAQSILIFVLFVNAFLMTKRIMPSTLGPAVQASSWYTLGIITAIIPLGYTAYSIPEFLVWYLGAFVFAACLVNGVMKYQKSKRPQQ